MRRAAVQFFFGGGQGVVFGGVKTLYTLTLGIQGSKCYYPDIPEIQGSKRYTLSG